MIEMVKSILLIDDSEATNNYNKRLIERAGFAQEIHIISSGKIALDFIKQNQENLPQLVFLDINMPGMDGFSFLNELQQLRKANYLIPKVVLLTTSNFEKDRLKTNQFKEVLMKVSKPLTYETLTVVEKHYNN